VNRKLTVLILLIALVMLLISAGCFRKAPEQRLQGIVDSIADKLDLNEAQRQKLDAMKQEAMTMSPDMKKTRQESFDDLIKIMRSTQVDPQKMKALAERNKAQSEQFISFFSAKFIEFHDMLTPEQREKAALEMERWKEHEQRQGNGGGGK
jgi:Spy/CpxP family protein refolding chaperone